MRRAFEEAVSLLGCTIPTPRQLTLATWYASMFYPAHPFREFSGCAERQISSILAVPSHLQTDILADCLQRASREDEEMHFLQRASTIAPVIDPGGKITPPYMAADHHQSFEAPAEAYLHREHGADETPEPGLNHP